MTIYHDLVKRQREERAKLVRETVIACGSQRAAARHLGVSVPYVSKIIKLYGMEEGQGE